MVPIVVIAVLLYIAFFVFADARATFHEIGRTGASPLCVALAISVLSFTIRALRWHALIGRVHVGIPFLDSLLVSFAGLAMTITPGKAGEVLKSLMLKEAYSVPVAKSAPVVLLERLCDLLAVVLLGGAGLVLVPGMRLGGLLSLAAGVGGVLGALVLPRFLHVVPDRWLDVPLLRARKVKVRNSLSALEHTLAVGPFLLALCLSILAWGVQSLCVWVLASSYPEGNVSIAAGVVAYCAPLLAGALALVPGGLGATEASMAGMLLVLGKPGLTLSVAAALTILTRLVTFWLAIGLGLGALGAWKLRKRIPAPELR